MEDLTDRVTMAPHPVRTSGSLFFGQRGQHTLWYAAIYVILITGAVAVTVPFFWMVSTALKEPAQIFAYPPVLIPHPIVWSNFVDALTVYPFGLWTANTLIIALTATVGTVLSTSLTAYTFARLRWPGRDVCFVLVLATMMLPGQVTLIPSFVLFKYLGWVNTWLPLIVPAWLARQGLYVFLMRQFFMTISLELDDAARVDGAGILQIYWRILMPLCKPVVAIVAIMFFQFKWDEFLGPLIYLNDSAKYTVALGLRMFQGSTYGSDWNLMMAAATTFILPLLVLFYFAQRYFVQGIVFTGIKG